MNILIHETDKEYSEQIFAMLSSQYKNIDTIYQSYSFQKSYEFLHKKRISIFILEPVYKHSEFNLTHSETVRLVRHAKKLAHLPHIIIFSNNKNPEVAFQLGKEFSTNIKKYISKHHQNPIEKLNEAIEHMCNEMSRQHIPCLR